MDAPPIKTALPGPESQSASSSATPRSCRRPTRAAIRSSSRAATAPTVEDVDGNIFLDCAAGIAVNSTGHSHPDVVARHRRSGAEVPPHVGHRFLLRAAGAAGARSSPRSRRSTGGVRSFFGNSGTEAIEAAIKLARYATKRYGHHRVSRQLSRPDAGLAVADRRARRSSGADSARCMPACSMRRTPTATAARSASSPSAARPNASTF